MIVVDTHIWVWSVHDENRLTDLQKEVIKVNESDQIGVRTISCWEIAKLVEYRRLDLHYPLKEWFDKGLNYPGIILLNLTPEISIESTQLPGLFHKDPADQIIVATARINNCPLVTSDGKILKYPHVKTIM
jgi:PIN domain nuclease of toxin-antitoxin system